MPPLPALADVLAGLHAMKGVAAPRPENLHFTLKFLGDTEEARVPAVQDALTGAAQPLRPFAIHLAGAGVFPPRGAPRVLWAGVSEGAQALVDLAAAVEAGLEPLGFPRERRPFVPHLTLARIKHQRIGEKARRLAQAHAATVWGTAACERVHLVRSTLRPDGPVYADLSEHPLRGG